MFASRVIEPRQIRWLNPYNGDVLREMLRMYHFLCRKSGRTNNFAVSIQKEQYLEGMSSNQTKAPFLGVLSCVTTHNVIRNMKLCMCTFSYIMVNNSLHIIYIIENHMIILGQLYKYKDRSCIIYIEYICVQISHIYI